MINTEQALQDIVRVAQSGRDLFLDICQGLGLGASAGVRPFLPALATGAKPLEAHCRAMLGTIHGASADTPRAEEFSAAAQAAYANLGMRPLLTIPLASSSAATN